MTKNSSEAIVHVAMVLDASDSMRRLRSKVIEQANQQIRDLKTRSEELNLETRVTVYIFSGYHQIFCPIFDRDVFRLGDLSEVYQTMHMTALVDATLKSQNDLAATAQMYGKHHFLTFVWTDGYENNSRNPASALSRVLHNQGANWSLAAFVPDSTSKQALEDMGFAPNNIQVWDVTAEGLEKAAKQSTQAADTYMTNVSKGVANDKTNVFGTGSDKVNAQTVQALTEITPGSFVVWDVTADERIDEFVRRNNRGVFNVGRGYYPLSKRETIQPNKDVLVMELATGKLYGGFDAVRQLLNLPKGVAVTVTPDANPDYKVYVKSTANNRKLLKGWKLIYLR